MVAPPIVDESCLVIAMATEGTGLLAGERLDRLEASSVEHMGTRQNHLQQELETLIFRCSKFLWTRGFCRLTQTSAGRWCYQRIPYYVCVAGLLTLPANNTTQPNAFVLLTG